MYFNYTILILYNFSIKNEIIDFNDKLFYNVNNL